ncbi:MAG: hypothetical protein K9L28_10520 [Synergistales bacterium]|nr:hypothetical protein [Synergistales bacterium]
MKKLTVLAISILILFASMVSAQDFSSLFPFERFSKWMGSTTLEGYQMAGVEDMSTDTTVSDRKYRAIFTGNQGMINVQLSQERFFYDYKQGNDFQNAASSNIKGLETVYLSKPQMPMSFIRVRVPQYKATFSIMSSPQKDQKSMEVWLEEIGIYRHFK